MEHNGYNFCSYSKRNGWTYYKCKAFKTTFCKASLKEKDGNIVVIRAEHSHPVEENNNRCIDTFRHELIKQAITTSIRLHDIYIDVSSRHMQAAELYSWPTAESAMRASRRRNLPAVPATISTLSEILEGNERFYSNIHGEMEPFYSGLVHGSANNIIFCSKIILEAVIEMNPSEIHADGTFKVVPNRPIARQLFTIHFFVRNHSIPMMYVLMETRHRTNYVQIFQYLNNLINGRLVITHIMTDFEPALQSALLEIYPNAQVAGCWFHYCQAIWRKMKKLGFLRLTEDDLNARKIVKYVMSLALLPAANIQQGFQDIRNFSVSANIHIDSLLEYVERHWIGRVRPEHFSVYDFPRRTNNNLEGFHSNLKHLVGELHPNIWVFIEKLIRLNKFKYADVMKLKNNVRITRPRKARNVLNDVRLRDAKANLANGHLNIFDYLQICSHAVDEFERAQRRWALQNEESDSSDHDEEDINEIPPVIPPAPEVNLAPDQPRCVICLSNPPTHLVVPCGHKIYCTDCSENQGNAERCPICNGEHLMVILVRE